MNNNDSLSLSPRVLLRSARCYLWPAIAVNSLLMSAVCKLSFSSGLVVAGSLILCATAGFLFNDLLDREIDKANKRKRLQGLTSLGLLLVFLCAASCWLLAVLVTFWTAPASQSLVILCVALGTAFYSVPLRSVPVVSTVLSALLCATPLWVPLVLAESPAEVQCVLLVGSAFAFFLGREIVLDVNDMKGDREHGRLTLPILVGRTTAIRVAQGALFLSCAISIPIPFLIDSTIARSLAVGGILCLLYICLAVAPRLSNRSTIEPFVLLSSRVLLVNAPMVCLALWVG